MTGRPRNQIFGGSLESIRSAEGTVRAPVCGLLVRQFPGHSSRICQQPPWRETAQSSAIFPNREWANQDYQGPAQRSAPGSTLHATEIANLCRGNIRRGEIDKWPPE